MNAITGTMGIAETPDSIKVDGGIGTLQEMYLLMLCRRDAKIWHERTQRMALASSDEPITGSPHGNMTERYEGRTNHGVPDPARQFFREEACPKCGTHYRYKTSHACVECVKRSSRAVKVAKAAARKLAAQREPVSRPGLRLSQVRRPETTAAEPNFPRTFEKVERWSKH
jgi:hypothetical protein